MPSSITWVQGSPQALIATPARILQVQRVRYLARMNRVLAEAVEDYKRFTESRGTEKSGKSGRVETGAMRDAVSFRVQQLANGSIQGELGFLDGGPTYFFLQTDTGFTHYLSGEFIEPTFALVDAARIAAGKLGERAY